MEIKQIILEELTKSDKNEIKKIARSEFEDMLKKNDIINKIENIVKKQLKDDKPTKKEIAKITSEVVVKLYKTFWMRRSFWTGQIEDI